MRKNNNGEGFCARVNCFAQETKIFQMWRIRLCFSRRCLIHVITSFVLAPPFDFTLCLASAGARVFYDDEDDDDNASEFNHQTRHCFHRQCVMFLLHKANHLVKGSRCRGGIVNIRFGCSRALLVTTSSFQGTLAVSCKYFKQSKWPNAAAYSHAYVEFIILTLNKILEYVEMTLFSRPCGSTRIPRRFRFFA